MVLWQKSKARIPFTRILFSGLEKRNTDPYGDPYLLQTSQSSRLFQAPEAFFLYSYDDGSIPES